MIAPEHARAARYAAIQERTIGPDGSFAAIGRSLAYRCGAFHLLADAAYRRMLPEHLTPEQCATLAARARPRHMVLTHFYPPVERVDIRAAMATQYAGPVTLGRDGWHIDLEDE